MSSRISEDSHRQAQELAILRESYQKRKEKIKSDGEKSLDATKESYRDKQQRIQEETQASINHIKRKKIERLRIFANRRKTKLFKRGASKEKN